MRATLYGLTVVILALISGCTTVTIDEIQHKPVHLTDGESVVILGRRISSDYETEPELISCIGTLLNSGDKAVNVVDEQQFVDKLYPWFEPRLAPMHVQDLQRLLSYKPINDAFSNFNIHYIVWVDGNTEKTRSSGSMSCTISAGFGGCFGFGTWDQKADYEASIWDYRKKQLIGKISSAVEGTSYMPAFVVPIPIIAPVQSDACKGMAGQLQQFFAQQ